MMKTIALAKQMDILFKHGQAQGLPVTYQAVAEAVGATADNIFRIHHGQNLNPRLRTLSALVKYFDTDLGYFSCKTKADYLNYLNGKPATPKLGKAVIIRRNRRTSSK